MMQEWNDVSDRTCLPQCHRYAIESLIPDCGCSIPICICFCCGMACFAAGRTNTITYVQVRPIVSPVPPILSYIVMLCQYCSSHPQVLSRFPTPQPPTSKLLPDTSKLPPAISKLRKATPRLSRPKLKHMLKEPCLPCVGFIECPALDCPWSQHMLLLINSCRHTF